MVPIRSHLEMTDIIIIHFTGYMSPGKPLTRALEIKETESVMGENARNDGRLTPEQWENIKQGIAARAHAARANMLREAFEGIPIAVRAAAGRWWSAYVNWRERNAAIKELAGLDDRTLKDMGLHRSEIESVIYDSSRRLAERKRAAVGRRTASTRAGAKPAVHRSINKTAA
jgi:uncharacterized protein YjiS (DUF1127 family)